MVDFSVFEYEYHSLSRLCVCGVAPGDRSQIKILYIYTGRNLYIYIYIPYHIEQVFNVGRILILFLNIDLTRLRTTVYWFTSTSYS
jgi:hypothetical protein